MAEDNIGIGIDPDKEILGCTDPTAANYNPLATVSTGPFGPYTAGNCSGGSGPGTICSGECYKFVNTGDGGGPDTDLDEVPLEPIDASDLFNCPETTQITINAETGIVTGPDQQALGLDCCTEEVVGFPVSIVTVGGKPNCVLVQTSCPPLNTLQIGPDQQTVITITDEDCCNINVVGQPVFWDGESCKLVSNNEECAFTDYVVQTVQQEIGPQVFGITFEGDSVPLNKGCCDPNLVGFDVTYDEEKNVCLQVVNPPVPTTTTITLNEEPLINNECDDLLVSAKLYFSQPPEECLNDSDIIVSLLPENQTYTVEQLGVFSSSSDGFNTWVDLGIRIVTTTTNEFNIQLSITGLLDGCCDYDIRVDNIRVDCFKEEDRVFFQNNKCPGFDLKRVIDNKKSWVYNPGDSETGLSEEDIIDRNEGDRGLLEKFGFVNRTFAPSADADLPWRYTDYYVQSNIKEPHSKAVINSKEMELTFNMCSECCVSYDPCPAGYTLSAGTETCYKTSIGCPSGFTLNGGICTSGGTCDCLNIDWATTGATGSETNLLTVGTLNGRNVWQFDVDGNLHDLYWDGGQWTIYEQFGSLEYTYPTDTDCPISVLADWTPDATVLIPFTALTITSGTCVGTTATTVTGITTTSSGSYCTQKVSLLQLEDYKKTFQSFWVRMIEQFVPATTIFVSGEKWCNNDALICTELEECDYDYEYVESEITVIEYGTDFAPVATGTTNNGGDVTDENEGGSDIDNESGGEPNDSNDGPIISDGTTVITTPNDPNSQTTIDNEEPFSGTRNQTLQNEVNVYNTKLTEGKPEIVFE